MATHLGNEGIVKVGSSTIAEVSSWSVSTKSETIEDTTMGDAWRTYKPGMKSWEGSVSCFWDETDVQGQEAMTVGSELTLNLYPSGDATGATYFNGAVIVTGVERTGAKDGIVGANFSFTGNGPLSSDIAA